MIFVDTGAWFALSIESDPDHLAAKSFVAANREEFITTDYVVDELLTLFKVRGQKAKGIEWLYDVLEGSGTHLYWVGEECFAEACRLYKEFAD
ncbi:MAG: type II toxin-antitoxin system VapC family toxin [Pirellulales bacterium]|nr:type II toxin-antitoxin system VapC family toxin [Pirellulales bacterium]